MDPLPAQLLQKTPVLLRATPAADKKIPPLSFGIPSETTDLRFSVHIKKSSGQTNLSSSIVCSDSIASDVSPELDESLPAQKVRLQRRPTCPAEPAKPGGGNKGARGACPDFVGELFPPHAFSVFCL